MRKRGSSGKRTSASAVSVEDPTDKSETNTESHFLQPTRHDILPMVLAVFAVALGLTAGLVSFFLLQNQEKITARDSLRATLKGVGNALNSAIQDVTGTILSTASLFQVSKTPITLDQFEPYLMANGAIPKFYATFTFSRTVPLSNSDALVQEMRASGYPNFTITGRDANNKIIPPPIVPIRCVITQAVPLALMDSILGYDFCTDPTKNESAYAAYYSGKPALSGATTLITRPNAVAVIIVTSIYNQTKTAFPIGMVRGTLILADLIQETVGRIIDGYDISLYDLNATGDNFMYTTGKSENKTMTSKQNADMVSTAEYTLSQNITFADRLFKVEIVPRDDYFVRFNTPSKYIALVISLVIMGLLLIGCLFLYFGRKLHIAKKRRAQANVQIDLLKTNQSALRTLLDRIATQESKTRAVINSLPDIVCVINPNGKILQTNTAFDTEFPYSQQEMEKGVYTWDIFTELSSDFFRVVKEIETTASRRFGDMFEVSVRVSDLKGNQGGSSASNEPKPSTNASSLHLEEQDEAYVIIAKNISAKSYHQEVNALEKVQRHDFERKFREKQFREEMKQYCEKNKSVENILFLEAVKEYKKATFGVRVDMKMSIFDRFIKIDAPMQLNLGNELVIDETIKINKSMGDVDVFKRIEESVFNTLANDIYPRYTMDQRKGSSDVIIENAQ
jgi:PAS domain S-box-containing protein